MILLAACAWIDDVEYSAQLDYDQDGFVAAQYGGDDCDDAESAVNPDAAELCDGIDNDCDAASDEDDARDAATWYADSDGDGWGSTAMIACERPAGYVTAAGDCRDGDGNSNPDAAEVWYDGIDQDCDGNDDDQDGDGSPLAKDCIDTDASIFPGAEETWYDGVDQDCDGWSDDDQDRDGVDVPDDCDDTDASVFPGAPDDWYDDLDADCAGDSDFDADGDGAESPDDCDDDDATRFPGAPESCDAIDSDCDGDPAEDDSTDAPTWYADADADTYGDASATQVSCLVPAGHVADATDCDDTTAEVTHRTWYADGDADEFGDASATASACDAPAGYVADATDCDDTSAATSPAGTEVCDTFNADEDCDGTADNDDLSATGLVDYYADADGDKFGDAERSIQLCDRISGYVTSDTDCDDTSSTIKPTGSEVCDELDADEDCDGLADDDDDSLSATEYFPDADDDGYGSSTATATEYCDAPDGYVANASDCDDTDGSVNAAAGNCSIEVSLSDVDVEFTDARAAGTNAGLGHTIAGGDIDADGYADVLIGAEAGIDAGAAYVWFGPLSGDEQAEDADAIYEASSSSNYSGVATAGDFDGDGDRDILIGEGKVVTAAGKGAAYVFHTAGTGTIALASADATLMVRGASIIYPSAISGAGDLDGDGLADIAVGSEYDGTAGTDAGAVFVQSAPFSGDIDLAAATALVTGVAAGDRAGTDVTIVSDLDADGFDELLVGAVASGVGSGAVYLVRGPISGTVDLAAADATFDADADQWLGDTVAGGGDLNADGYGDFAFGGAEGYYGDPNAYVFEGPLSSATTLADAAASLYSERETYGMAGQALAFDGDVDEDGKSDLLVGDTYGSTSMAGHAYILLSPVSGAVDLGAADWRLDGPNNWAMAGWSIAYAGDTDADGSDDLLIGAYYGTTTSSVAGMAWLVTGASL